jgi:hypothetical protein
MDVVEICGSMRSGFQDDYPAFAASLQRLVIVPCETGGTNVADAVQQR